MRPFLALWTGDRNALVQASDRPNVWLPKESGDDRWELRCPQGPPPTGDVVMVRASVESRRNGGYAGHATRRIVSLLAPTETPELVLCRTELRLLTAAEAADVAEPGWSLFDHPDGREADLRSFWRLFRMPLPEPGRYAATFAAPRRVVEPAPEKRRVPDPIARFEAMADENGRVNAEFVPRGRR